MANKLRPSINRGPFDSSTQKGSITVFFLLFAVVMIGAISYSLYFAHAANEKIRIENAADAEAQAMAAHAAKGLNMIAANNLGIGAAMHIAGAMPILSRYAAMVRATMSTCGDIGMNVSVLAGQNGAYQDIFDWFMPISKAFLKTAAGLTTVNRQIGRYWLAPSLLRGIESLRLNAPGAVTIPLQLSTVSNVRSDIASALLFRYRGLMQTTASTAMCHAIDASSALSNRDNPIFWLQGPFSSFGKTGNFGRIASLVGESSSARQKSESDMDYAESKWAYSCVKIPHTHSVVDPSRCRLLTKMREARKKVNAYDSGGMFQFGSCGIGYGSNYASQINHYFSDDESSIGFIYPDPGPQGEYEEFKKSIDFAAISGLAFRVHKDGDKPCPTEWLQKIAGNETCQSMGLWHYVEGEVLNDQTPKSGQEAAKEEDDDDDFNLAVGGMVQMLKDPKSLKSSWSRTKWAISQAKAYYSPSTRQQDADPPRTSDNLSLFWPSWQSKMTPSTVVKDLTEVLF